MSIIYLKNISKIYNEKKVGTHALKNINLKINSGDFIAIMGPSGSGKSTLLNIIGCMDIPTNGEYYLGDDLIGKMNNKQLSKLRNTKFSFIFQNFALMKDYNVYDNVELPLMYRDISDKDKRNKVIMYLEKIGIIDKINNKPTELSGGQKQRVAIARALVSDADIILGDEPTGALDQKTGQEIMELLKEINRKGKTIIIVTHDLKVASYCDRIINVVDGQILENK
ncbi:ABC transporter ATP-binding protein [Clostridium botulinum]|nr:ABC transporter ATP-binding protein [Clostridium botulinum]